MENTVAVAAITVAGTAVAGVIWLAKFFAKALSKDMREHTKAALKQVSASEKQTRALQSLESTVKIVGDQGREHHEFMKNLNGKLAKATIQTVKEQHVEKAVIDKIETKSE